MEERRQFPRLALPMDASFLGRSGASSCRVSDISWGGCFLQTVSQASIGQRTVITFPTLNGTVGVPGTVLYVEPSMGFAVRFDTLTADQIEGLSDVLGEPPEALLQQLGGQRSKVKGQR